MRIPFVLAVMIASLAAYAPAPANAHDVQHMQHDMSMDSAQPLPGRSIYNLGSKWTRQDGADVAIGSLSGKPVITAMVYTSCPDMCPAIVADMMWIDKHLPPDAEGHVQFALFSFDAAVDTPARLKAYADEHALDLGRWSLYHGDEDAVRELAAALGVSYRPDGHGGFDHAEVISLLDDKGEIVFQQRGTEARSEELLAKVSGIIRAED
jgi:protein SCO1/2